MRRCGNLGGWAHLEARTMHGNRINRREAGARLIHLAAAAGVAGGVPGLLGAALAQPAVPKKEKKPSATSAQPGAASPVTPMASVLDKLVRRGRTRDWTLKIWVDVHSYQNVQRDAINIAEIKFDTAAVVFPINRTTATSELDAPSVKGVLKFDDRVMDDQPKYSDALTPPVTYQCGTRIARWEMKSMSGREVELQLELPLRCFEVTLDEPAAMKIKWPGGGTLPAALSSALQADAIVDSNDNQVRALVRRWTEGKDPKAILPVKLAKFLAGRVLEHTQPNGNGLAFDQTGLLEGVDLQLVGVTASTGRGSEHDIAVLLCAVYRAAGLPARLVIGYDVTEKKGEDASFLQKRANAAKVRAWVEFALYDEAAQKELWLPVDIVRQRSQSNRAPSLDTPWKFFGNNDETDDIMPFAFQYHPPTTVVAHGFPGFWGWFTTPTLQNVSQTLRFECQTTPRRTTAPEGQPSQPTRKD